MQPEPETRLLDVFKTAGVQPELFVLHHGSRTVSPMTKGQVEQLAKKLQSALGTQAVEKKMEADGLRYTGNGFITRNIMIQWIVINDKPSNHWVHPYLSMQLIGKGEPGADLREARNRCTEVLRENGIIPSYHFSVQGSRPVSNLSKEMLLIQVIRDLKAKEVEVMRTDRTSSLSLYSPMLPGGIRTGGGLMNVQAAVRVSDDAHRLILTLGTPIITIEY
jgi:hypothetical protein